MTYIPTNFIRNARGAFIAALLLLAITGFPVNGFADETCMSPYMAKIVGQEDYVYVWTLGAEGVGDEQDKLVTVDVNPGDTLPPYITTLTPSEVGSVAPDADLVATFSENIALKDGGVVNFNNGIIIVTSGRTNDSGHR